MVAGIMGHQVLWKIFQKIKPGGLEVRLKLTKCTCCKTSIAMFLSKLGCFAIWCAACIADNEGHPTNMISGCHLLAMLQTEARKSLFHSTQQCSTVLTQLGHSLCHTDQQPMLEKWNIFMKHWSMLRPNC